MGLDQRVGNGIDVCVLSTAQHKQSGVDVQSSEKGFAVWSLLDANGARATGDDKCP